MTYSNKRLRILFSKKKTIIQWLRIIETFTKDARGKSKSGIRQMCDFNVIRYRKSMDENSEVKEQTYLSESCEVSILTEIVHIET